MKIVLWTFGLAFCLSTAHAEWNPVLRKGIEVSYRGKYEKHPLFRRMMREMPSLRARAVELVNRALGISFRDDYTIVLRFADATDEGDVSREKDMKQRGRPNLLSRGRTGD